MLSIETNGKTCISYNLRNQFVILFFSQYHQYYYNDYLLPSNYNNLNNYQNNPYFIHFYSYLRRSYVAPRCGIHDIYHNAMKEIGIYGENIITKHVNKIQNCCVKMLDFNFLQDFFYEHDTDSSR